MKTKNKPPKKYPNTKLEPTKKPIGKFIVSLKIRFIRELFVLFWVPIRSNEKSNNEKIKLKKVFFTLIGIKLFCIFI